ncbi:MAG: LamG domain-containing protein [Phycisphaerae bacterium]|nr:LamG domain-containing protein [Phycisphaerae bacterium]
MQSSRRQVLVAWAVMGVLPMLPIGPAHAAERSLGDLSGSWILFVDDHAVESMRGVCRHYHAFEKHSANPLLVADRSWEGQVVYLYGSVLPGPAGTGYRMWYHAWDPAVGEYRNLYATSADGLTWAKPNLGLVQYEGSTANNIFLRRTGADHIASVIHTPWAAQPAQAYRLVNFDYRGGFYGASSAEGLYWTDVPDNPLLSQPEDVGNFVWDSNRACFLGTPKILAPVRGWMRRCVGVTMTPDFEQWPDAGLLLVPDAWDDRWAAGNQRTEFYGLSAFAYESMYLGFLWVFRIEDGVNGGPIFAELVSSHDGYHWTRQEGDRPSVLTTGQPGAWDAGMVFTPNHPLIEGDRILLYYGGFNLPHGSTAPSFAAAIGLASLRKDGFASLGADSTQGEVLTRSLTDTGGTLRVNCDASAGLLRVEVLDADGAVIPGFAAEECRPITSDGVSQPVSWNEHQLLPSESEPLRLRFLLDNASLFAFEAGPYARVVDDGPIRPAFLCTGEGGTAALVDKLISDGRQAATPHNNVYAFGHPAYAAFGSGAVAFLDSGSTLNTLEIVDTTLLGERFTLAAMVRHLNNDHARLFTAYDGADAPLTSELVFDFDPSGTVLPGLRFRLNGQSVLSTPVSFADGAYHHLAATCDGGSVRLYLDGVQVGQGSVPAGTPVVLRRNLRVAEDFGPGVQEQLVGMADDILVYGEVLTGDEVQTLAEDGAEKLFGLDVDLDWDGDVDLADYARYQVCAAAADPTVYEFCQGLLGEGGAGTCGIDRLVSCTGGPEQLPACGPGQLP